MMKRVLMGGIVLLLTMSGCERRELIEEMYQTAKLRVAIDWSAASLDPQNDPEGDLYRASVWLFSKDGPIFNGKSYKEYRLNSCLGGEIDVPVGHYSALVFNNSVSEFSSCVGFRGTDRYETFEYYLRPDARSSQLRNDLVASQLEPDILAVWRIDELEVTPDVVVFTRTRTKTKTKGNETAAATRTSELADALLNVQPTRLTHTSHVEVHVKQLRSVASAEGAIQGLAGGVYLASGHVADEPITSPVTLTGHTYDAGSTVDGTLWGTFNTFGPLPDPTATYALELSFTLTAPFNGSTTYPTPPAAPFRYDITQQVLLALPVDDPTVGLDFDIQIGFGLTPDEEVITLPVVSTGSGGGFSAVVEGWGEEVEHELIL